MLSSLLYLTTRTAANRFVSQLKRIRQPRYAIAIVVGVAYFWYFLISPRYSAPDGGEGPFSFLTSGQGRAIITFGVFLLFAASWLFGRRGDALAFSPAEVHFLFPAPVTRRWLIGFKLARSQIAILISTIIWTILIRRSMENIHPLAHALGLWLLFATLSVHQLVAALVHVSVLQRGPFGDARQRILTVVLVALSSLYTFAAFSAWRTVTAVPVSRSMFLDTLSAMLQQPLLGALMKPFTLLATPAFASTIAEWRSALPWAVLILAVHLALIMRLRIAFEEPAVEASVRVAKRVADFRSRGIRGSPQPSARAVRSTRIMLSPTGEPALAIVWKNGLAFLRSFRSTSLWLSLVLIAPLAVAFLMISDTSGQIMVAGSTLAMFLLWSIILGPRFVRNDLRADLTQLSLLKTFPLSGSRIVGAEVASATLSLTAIQMGIVAIIFAMSFFQKEVSLNMIDRALVLVGAPLCLAAINSVNLSIQNGATLLFPAWMTLGMNRPSGVEAMGQNLLLVLASLILLAVSLIPASLAGVLGYFLTSSFPVRVRVIVVVLAGLAVLLAEVWLLMQALGRLFERTEPSATT